MATETQSISIVFEDPAVLNKHAPKSSHSKTRLRRNHTKSRNGCYTCRQRHIKCNEARPECLYCWQKAIPCRYMTDPSPPSTTTTEESSLSPSDNNLYINETQRTKALQALEREHIPCLIIKDPVYKTLDALYLLEFFVSSRETEWIASSACQAVMQEHAFELSLQSSYLLHAVLAFTAAYLNFQDPDNKKWRIASTLHYHKSLNQFQQHLVGEPEESEADTMMACSILLSLLAFVHTAADPVREDSGPAWVRSMQATQILSQDSTLRPGLTQGVWAPLLHRFDDWRANIFGTYLDLSPRSSIDLEQIRALGHLCAKHASLERQQHYKTPLFMLDYLAQLPPHLEIANRFVYFVPMLSKDFINLLDLEDPFAMLMIAFWCAFLSRIDQWWISFSAGRECGRICTAIRRRGETQLDEIVQYLLGLPSVAKHVQ